MDHALQQQGQKYKGGLIYVEQVDNGNQCANSVLNETQITPGLGYYALSIIL